MTLCPFHSEEKRVHSSDAGAPNTVEFWTKSMLSHTQQLRKKVV